MANVLLLRARSQEEPDKYEDVFRRENYNPISVPVLETVLKNLPELKDVVAGRYDDNSYAGVIITSARSCEAWREVVVELSSEGTTAEGRRGWESVPFYVVGEATSSALSAIHTAFPSSPYAPRDIRGGGETGTSEKLAHLIVADLSSAPGSKLLYLTGDKNRDTLPKILGDAGFEIQALQAYETQGSAQFPAGLEAAVTAAPEGIWWIVYFAPSAADFVTPCLKQYFSLRAEDDVESNHAIPRAKVAAIGPTTSTFLREHLKLAVNTVPAKPNPEGLLSAILHADHREE